MGDCCFMPWRDQFTGKKMSRKLFENGQRVWWKSKANTREEGTIMDVLLKKKNPHLKSDSYLVQFDFNGMIHAVAIKGHGMRRVASKANKRRLESLIRVIQRVPKGQFNMDFWVDGGINRNRASCGTVGCAGGHFCLSPEGKRLGLRYDEWLMYPVYKTKDREFVDLFAMGAVFGITDEDTHYIFDPATYGGFGSRITKQQVIGRIRKVMKQNEQ